uniref:Uncharacterized protein n=1 Tax=Ditylenchus dipsaci TaxID=166011 RepID=A0A915D6R9_9BILA
MSAKRKRNIIITPFNGDRANFAKYKSAVIDFVKNYFVKVLGADPPGIQACKFERIALPPQLLSAKNLRAFIQIDPKQGAETPEDEMDWEHRQSKKKASKKLIQERRRAHSSIRPRQTSKAEPKKKEPDDQAATAASSGGETEASEGNRTNKE